MSTLTTDTPPPSNQASPGKPRRRRRWLIPIALVLAGVLVLLYPVAATQYNNHKQRSFAEQYNSQVMQAAPEQLEDALDRARAYNKTLPGVPILDPWLEMAGADPSSDAFTLYKAELGDYDAMARIQVPRVGIDLPVYHGTSDPVLAKGAGHLYGTSLPVGGESTHSVLTSHTGFANATLFDHLADVEEGDLMLVDVMGERLAYRVDQIKVVEPTEISDLTTIEGADYLTLFTCTPYAVNTHRLLVRGERVPYDQTEIDSIPQDSSFQLETWMWWLIAGAVVGATGLTVILIRERRRNKDQEPQAPSTD